MDRKDQSRILMQQRRDALRRDGWKTLTVYVRPEDEEAVRALLATLPQPESKRRGNDRDSGQH
jgi:hypothetical protein